ncbi:hypothetical protein [Robertkochia aurantiaca]|uniref:hypothetical protein n=1 Tax=Robertkochia aurantiaca TaxID=2873700 RepID=UPI001CCAD5FD|nr:hypothetical protein [Robertkochia sp. 3YJGBD-33]
MHLSTKLLIIPLLLISLSGFSQEKFEGKLDKYDQEAGDIYIGFMDPVVVGTIDASGAFEIPLDQTIIEKSLASFDTAEKDGWTATLRTTGGHYTCNGDTLDIAHPEQTLFTMAFQGSYGIADVDEEKPLGAFMAVDSPEFARAFSMIGQEDMISGYYLDWYYFEQPFTVDTECVFERYAYNQEDVYEVKTIYDLDFKAGWNLVRYQVEEVYSDPDGPDMPRVIRYSTMDNMPDDVVFHYISEGK